MFPWPAFECPSSVAAARKYNIRKTLIEAVSEALGRFLTATKEHMSCIWQFSLLHMSLNACHMSDSSRTEVLLPRTVMFFDTKVLFIFFRDIAYNAITHFIFLCI